MHGTMLIFRPHERHPMAMHFDRAPTLEQLKKGIGGGYLELVPWFKTVPWQGVIMDCVAFCDEEGKLKELPVNQLATALWVYAMERSTGTHPSSDYLVGQVAVLFGDREFMETL